MTPSGWRRWWRRRRGAEPAEGCQTPTRRSISSRRYFRRHARPSPPDTAPAARMVQALATARTGFGGPDRESLVAHAVLA
jgi:hypothetical protein